jgi:hypothetical protein
VGSLRHIHPLHLHQVRLIRIHGDDVICGLHYSLKTHRQPTRSLVVDLGCGRHRHVGDDLDIERAAIVMRGVIP